MADELVAPQSTPFFSAWRPVIGWISVVGFGIKFVGLPLLGIVLVLIGKPVEAIPPNVDFTSLMLLVGTALGFGGMRSAEKMKGVIK